MARWIKSGVGNLKVVKDGRRRFRSYDDFIEYHNRHGWRRRDWRSLRRLERGMR